MAEKINATCSICGNGYYMCRSCKDMMQNNHGNFIHVLLNITKSTRFCTDLIQKCILKKKQNLNLK